MAPKKSVAKGGAPKAKKESLSIVLKKEIIAKHERGIRVMDIAKEYGRSHSTISTILKQKDALKKLDVAKGVSIIAKNRPKLLDEVEKLLMVWINDKQLKGDSISEGIICEKAMVLHADLVRKSPGTASEDEFKASRGWFDNFKKRTGIHSVVRHGDAASSDKAAAERFVPEFRDFVASEGLVQQQVFNCDETGLFWKKLTKRTYITQEEKSLPGHKPMKDRLTLVLCANASGDFKAKPLLVYHSENPRVFNKFNVHKNRLHVMWRSNKKSWVTRIFFSEWINDVFAPSVRKYLEEKGLPVKALLVLDNAPAHPPQLQQELYDENKLITIKFLPPNTTPLLQPMDQRVISNIKKLYTKVLLQRCIEVTDRTNLTLKEFWKDHFNIVGALGMIDKAWQGVTVRTLNSAWRNLWPEGVPERDFEGFGPAPASAPVDDPDAELVEEIVSLGRSLHLEMDADDVEELVEEHSEELTTDELQELHNEQHQEGVQELSSGEEVVREDTAPSSAIKEMFEGWEKVQSFLERYHPDKVLTARSVNLFSDTMLSRFRDILKQRQKQVSIDKFFGKVEKRRSSEPQPGPSGVKFPRRKSPPDSEVDSPPSP